MTPTVLDVASFILREEEGEMSTMKLQKLCYFSQGWSLAWSGNALFDDDFEAWANGPVSRRLFSTHRLKYSVASISGGNADNLDDIQALIVRTVLGAYAKMSGLQLSELTHRGTPWILVRGDLPDGASCSEPIGKTSIKQSFENLQGPETAIAGVV